jgi:sporulation protein YlmC with PRC-barrel domain
LNAEPVSWLVIERGWTVVAADGTEVGRVEEVIGDTEEDIFNGLAISTSLLGAPKYVPAERVTGIEEGRIELDLPQEAAHELPEYNRPTQSEELRP